MTKRERFIKKYGIDPIEIVDKALLKWVDNEFIQKQPETTLNTYFEENKIDINADRYNTEFWIYLIEAFQEAGEKWPNGWRNILMDDIPILDPTPVNPPIPKEKPVLETFKDIVSDDDLRPNLTGVYVDKDNLVGTDAYKILTIKNDEYKQYNGKIINLEIYLKSKGRKMDFIDQKFPQFKEFFEKEKILLANDLPLYNLYNLAKSTAQLLKFLEKDRPFPINFKFNELEQNVSLSPILLNDVILAAMQNGYTHCDWYATKQGVPILIFDFGRGSKGLIMPIMATERGTPPITLKRILEEWGGIKAAKPKPIAAPITPSPKPTPKPKSIPVQKSAKSKELELLEKMILLNLSDI